MDENNITQIIVAIIALVSAIFGSILGYIGKTKKQAILDATREQEQKDNFNKLFNEIESIKKRLDVHNSYAEKIGGIKEDIALLKKDVEYIRKGKNGLDSN